MASPIGFPLKLNLIHLVSSPPPHGHLNQSIPNDVKVSEVVCGLERGWHGGDLVVRHVQRNEVG